MEKTIFELKESRYAKIEVLEGLVAKSNPSTEDEKKQADLEVEIKKLNKQIEVAEMKERSKFEKPVEIKANSNMPAITDRSALKSFVQKDYQDLAVEERAILTSTVGSAMLPKTVSADVITLLRETSPMYRVADVRTVMDTNDYVWVVDKDTDTGEVVTEGDSTNSGDTAFTGFTFYAYQYSSKKISFSDKVLKAASFDMEQSVIGNGSNRIAKIINANASTNSGATGLKGIEADVTTGVTATGVTHDNLYALYFSVAEGYRRNPKAFWMMSDTALASIGALTNDEKLSLLFENRGGTFFLIGKEIVVNNSLTSVIFGDFNYYKIVERGQVSLSKDYDIAKFQYDLVLGLFIDGKYTNPGDNPLKQLKLA